MKNRHLMFIALVAFAFVILVAVSSAVAVETELQAMPDQTRSLEVPPPAEAEPLDTPLIIPVMMIKGAIPESPASGAWNGVDSVRVPLSGQVVAKPKNFNPSVKWVDVQAVSNGKEIGIRLSWQDGTRDDAFIRHEDFKDAAAVQFPVKVTKLPEKPHFAMGNPDEIVNIWHWKAEWDKDSSGMADMEDTYPNMAMGSSGFYIYEPQFSDPLTKRITAIDSGMGKEEGVFNPGLAAGNIFSNPAKRVSPVEDLNAEGFGTLTTQEKQNVKGKGNWSNSEWSVVFTRTLSSPDSNDAQLDKWGEYAPVAFAVWDGSSGERDGMKAISGWHYLKIK